MENEKMGQLISTLRKSNGTKRFSGKTARQR